MTQKELFYYVQKYNSVSRYDLVRIPEISHYNHNYYQGEDGYILYGESDDDNYTAWYLCDKPKGYLVCFGESFCSCGDVIEVYTDIRCMHFMCEVEV